MLYGYQKDGFMNKFNLTFSKQIKMQVGILNGVGQKHVNLLNIKKDSTMDGMWIVGNYLMHRKIQMIHSMEKLENYPLQFHYPIQKLMLEVN